MGSKTSDPTRETGLAVVGQGLSRRFGARWALKDVSLAATYGSVLLVAGRNGSGKTTLFRVLATAIRMHRGQARVAGFDLARDRHDARRSATLLSHRTYLYEALTACENLAFAARLGGAPSSRARLTALLERVALADRADDRVGEFSAGMRKRLALARALLRETPVVLFDEPYGQLDPEGFALVDRIVEECRVRGAAVLLATHQIERGRRLCRDAIVLDNGRGIWSGPAADLPLAPDGRVVALEDGAA